MNKLLKLNKTYHSVAKNIFLTISEYFNNKMEDEKIILSLILKRHRRLTFLIG